MTVQGIEHVHAGVAAATGAAGLGVLTVISNVRGEDPSFFGAVAVPTNLAIFGGLVALAVALKRSGRLFSAVAIALPFSWIAALPMSAIGGAVVAGGYFFALGWMLLNGELPRPAVRSAEPARA